MDKHLEAAVGQDQDAKAMPNSKNQLVSLLTQWPIMSAVAAALRPHDLLSLTLTCRLVALHASRRHKQGHLTLHEQTLCSGEGLNIRMLTQHRCSANGFATYIGCAGDGYSSVESKPCAECRFNTCDECRIHVFYHVFVEDPGLDNRRWWAGFCFLDALAIAILPPSNSDNSSWYFSLPEMSSHHDSGRVHLPLDVHALADPESLDHILDTDLGKHRIVPHGRTDYPYQGQLLMVHLMIYAERRVDSLCMPCFDKRNKNFSCSCTLRKRYLDRWLCVPCYSKERDRRLDQIFPPAEVPDHQSERYSGRLCTCGTALQLDSIGHICTWCNGSVERTSGGNVVETEAEEQDEDVSSVQSSIEVIIPTLAHLDHTRYYTRPNGSLTMTFEGTQIPRNCIGRYHVRNWAKADGQAVNEEVRCGYDTVHSEDTLPQNSDDSSTSTGPNILRCWRRHQKADRHH